MDKDLLVLPKLVKQRLLLLDLDVKYQLDLHYGGVPKQVKFKGGRWRMYRTLIQQTKDAWHKYTKNKYPNRMIYTVYGWVGRTGFEVIHTGKVGYWREEWDDYPYTYFVQLPDPPSYRSYYKDIRRNNFLNQLAHVGA